MTALTDAEQDLLRKVRDAKCDTGCPCDSWARALADHLRREFPNLDDITLARVAVITSLHGRGWARCDADGLQVATVICAAAGELASLHPD